MPISKNRKKKKNKYKDKKIEWISLTDSISTNKVIQEVFKKLQKEYEKDISDIS